jgi:hypothetical protein
MWQSVASCLITTIIKSQLIPLDKNHSSQTVNNQLILMNAIHYPRHNSHPSQANLIAIHHKHQCY